MPDNLPKVPRRQRFSELKQNQDTIPTELALKALTGATIGSWKWDIARDLVHCSEATGRLFGLLDRDFDAGVPIRRFEERIHPDDLPHFSRVLMNSCREGGLFIAEYRTMPRPGIVHWLLARGTFNLDDTGMALDGQGIVIDITAAQKREAVDDRGIFVSRLLLSTPVIDTVAENVLDALDLASKLEPESFARLRPMFDRLLYEIGLQVAAELGDGAPTLQTVDGESH